MEGGPPGLSPPLRGRLALNRHAPRLCGARRDAPPAWGASPAALGWAVPRGCSAQPGEARGGGRCSSSCGGRSPRDHRRAGPAPAPSPPRLTSALRGSVGDPRSPHPVCQSCPVSVCLSPLPRPALAFPVNRASGALLRGPLAGSVLVRSLLWGRRVTLEGPRGLGAGRPGCGLGPARPGHLLSLRSGAWQACPRAQRQPRVLRERRVRAAARLGPSTPWRCLVSCRDLCGGVCGPAPVSQADRG